MDDRLLLALLNYVVDHAAAIIAAGAAIAGLFTLKTIKVELNSRLTQLLDVTAKSERAEGREEGRTAAGKKETP